jgi:hypothetical protein
MGEVPANVDWLRECLDRHEVVDEPGERQLRQDERTLAALAAGLRGHMFYPVSRSCACGDWKAPAVLLHQDAVDAWTLHAAAAQLHHVQG